jgi:small-conductance mechanosensitive channel
VDRVAALGEYGVTLKILGTVRAPDQWAAAGELRKRLLAAFTEHGIEIPRPQRVILSRDLSGQGPFPPGDEGMVEPAQIDGTLGGD